MAKVTGGLLSLSARGKIADTLVFSNWKGIDTVRQYVVPSNPNSAGQSTQRGHMTNAVDQWHDTTNVLSATDKSAWDRYAGALSRAMSGFNAFCKGIIDEVVAGGTPGHFFGVANVTLTHNAFKADIDDSLAGTLTVTLHVGNSKTFSSAQSTDAQVGGLTSFAAFDTGYPAGETVYYWFEAGTVGVNYKRSGLYTGVLT